MMKVFLRVCAIFAREAAVFGGKVVKSCETFAIYGEISGVFGCGAVGGAEILKPSAQMVKMFLAVDGKVDNVLKFNVLMAKAAAQKIMADRQIKTPFRQKIKTPIHNIVARREFFTISARIAKPPARK